jgi:drug/metabolite transporter (DMT)-like permease
LHNAARSYTRVYALLVVVMVFWCGNSIVGRAIANDIPPFTLAFTRWSLGLVILVPLAWRKVRSDWPTIVATWPRIVLLGVLGVASFNAFLYSGLHDTTATNALLIQAGIPTLVLVFDWLLFGAKPPLARAAGVALSALGVFTIIFQAKFDAIIELDFRAGDVLILGSIIAWSLYTALLRVRPPIDQMSFLTLTFVVGAALMLPLACVEWRYDSINLTLPVLAGVGYIAIFPSVVAYLLFNGAVAKIGPAAAGQAISLQPLIGAGLAALLLGETLRSYHWLGMVLVLLGLAVPMVVRSAVRN